MTQAPAAAIVCHTDHSALQYLCQSPHACRFMAHSKASHVTGSFRLSTVLLDFTKGTDKTVVLCFQPNNNSWVGNAIQPGRSDMQFFLLGVLVTSRHHYWRSLGCFGVKIFR